MAALASQVLRIFMSEIENQLIRSCNGITSDTKLGAVSFIQRFGSRLNLPIHFHCVVFDGVFYTDQKGILQFSDVTQFANEYYRPDTAASLILQASLQIEAAASQLILKSPPKAGAKLGEINSKGV